MVFKLYSPSGERRPAPLRAEAHDPSCQPLAGRSSYAARLAAFRTGYGPKPEVGPYLGLPGGKSPPLDDAMFYAPELERRFAWPVSPRYAAAYRCVVCGLAAAFAMLVGAIVFFWFMRPAAALTPAMLPRVPMEQDVVFGVVACGILLVVVGGFALYRILRGDMSNSEPWRTPVYFLRSAKFPFFTIAIQVSRYDWKYLWPTVPTSTKAPPPYQRPANGPCFGEDDRYA